MHMAWENFWTRDDRGRHLTNQDQFAAFKRNFPERIVPAIPEIRRPLMIVLDRPYQLSRFPAAAIYEHKPVHLRELNGWPPSLSLSRFGHLPRPGDGELVNAKVVHPERPGADPLLVIRAEFQEQPAACTIVGYPALLLECIAATLNEHVGEEIRTLGDCALVGVD